MRSSILDLPMPRGEGDTDDTVARHWFALAAAQGVAKRNIGWDSW